MIVKELIDKLQQFNGDRVVLVEDTEYGEFQAIKYNKMEYHKSVIGVIISITCLTGFEVHGQAACVKPENFDLNVGSNYARIKAEDKIWKGLGFVLQWAKYGLKK